MQSCQRVGKPLIVTCQTAKAGGLRNASLHDPASRQQDKSTLGLGMFDDHQLHAKVLRLTLRRFACVSLIDKGDIHRAARYFLYRLRQLGYLLAVLLVGRRHMQRQQMSQRIDGKWTFDPLRRLAPS